jgi:hypothetical protein
VLFYMGSASPGGFFYTYKSTPRRYTLLLRIASLFRVPPFYWCMEGTHQQAGDSPESRSTCWEGIETLIRVSLLYCNGDKDE